MDIVGLPEEVLVYINGSLWINRQRKFPNGTVLPELEIAASGYVIEPPTIASGEVVTEDKTYSFTATETSDTADLTIDITGLPEEYEVYVDNVLWVDHKKSFPLNTSLVNITPVIAGYALSPVSVASITLDSDKTLTYVATAVSNGRKWSIDLGNEFTNPPVETGITWNLFHPTNVQITTPNGKTLSNMKTESGDDSTVSLTNVTAFDGASGGYVNYTSSNPVWPINAVNSGISLGTLSTFRLTGLDDAKLYTVRVLSAITEANSQISINIGSTTVNKVSTANLPADFDNRYTSSVLAIISNIATNGSGEISINLNRIGGFYISVANIILLEEQ